MLLIIVLQGLATTLLWLFCSKWPQFGSKSQEDFVCIAG